MQAYDVHAIVIFPFRVEAENEYQAERILEAALPICSRRSPAWRKVKLSSSTRHIWYTRMI